MEDTIAYLNNRHTEALSCVLYLDSKGQSQFHRVIVLEERFHLKLGLF